MTQTSTFQQQTLAKTTAQATESAFSLVALARTGGMEMRATRETVRTLSVTSTLTRLRSSTAVTAAKTVSAMSTQEFASALTSRGNQTASMAKTVLSTHA